MGALDAYDDFDRQIDAFLAADVPDLLPLEELYDASVLAAIEAGSEPPAPVRAGWRGGVAAGAMVVGLVNGVRDVLGADDEDAVVEIDETPRPRALEPVSVHMAWGNPAASVAIVRPWLF